MRSVYYRFAMALVCAFAIICRVYSEENGSTYLRKETTYDRRHLSKGKGSGSSSSSRSSISSKSAKSSKSPGSKDSKSSKGKGGKGVKSSKSPKSWGKGEVSEKGSKSYGKGGKGGKSNKSSKSSKSNKMAKSSKYPKKPKSFKNAKPSPSPTKSPIRSGPDPDTAAPTMAPVVTPAPTKAPVVGPPTICGRTEEERVEFISDILSGLSTPDALNNPNSPQGRASQWLINNDPIALCPDSSTQVVQRFSLAVFYYSTNGDQWNFCRAQTGDCPTEAQRFLSGGSECEWYGIECNANGRILNMKLDALDGQDINLDGNLPAEIFLMPRIRDVELGYSNSDVNQRGSLSGSIPSTIAQASQIRAFDVDRQNISGPIPDAFYQSTLREVDLDNNRLTGTISSNVRNMKNLIFFTASNNPFDPQQIPAGFGDIPELRFLGLNNANLIGPVPSSFNNLRELRAIDLRDNALTGDISFLSNYSFLQSLAISNNNFSGDIPLEFWQKTNLEIANLENNQLTGTIPPSIGTMTELRTLRLAGNNMSGTIPIEIANLTNLRVLTLEGNNFTGSLPEALCNLRDLEPVTVPATIECPRFCCTRIP